MHILSNVKNSIVDQFKMRVKLATGGQAELSFTDDALEAIADKALARGTGARGLRSIVEKAMEDTFIELPDRENVGEVIVSADVINNGTLPEIVEAQTHESWEPGQKVRQLRA